MLQIITDAPETVAAWTAGQLDIPDFGPCQAMGIVKDGVVIAGLVYNQYRPEVPSIELSVASTSPRWLDRRTIHAMFHYPFNTLGVRRLSIATLRSNKRARRVAERLGWKYEGMGRKAGPGETDMAIYSMLREECRWL